MCSASKDCCRCTWPWDPGELLRKCEAFFDFARFIGTEPLETTTTRGACMSPGWTRPRWIKIRTASGTVPAGDPQPGLPGLLPLAPGLARYTATEQQLDVSKLHRSCFVGSVVRSQGNTTILRSWVFPSQPWAICSTSILYMNELSLETQERLWTSPRLDTSHDTRSEDTSWQLKTSTHTRSP